jgi:hypothetical protein
MSYEDLVVGVTATCQLCNEPCVNRDGVYVHEFTGKPQCTYRSHL